MKITPVSLADYLPIINPRSSGHKGQAPVRSRSGATRYDPRITIISNPPHPDNFRLTLKTEHAPPKLKLPKDLKIPDLIAGGPGAFPEPGKAVPPPAPEKAPPPAPVKPPAAQPFRPVVPHNAAPVNAAAPPPTLQMAPLLPTVALPHLEVPAPPPAPPLPQTARAAAPHPQAAPESKRAAAPASLPSATQAEKGGTTDTPKTGGGPKILALSVDPIPFKDLSSIPAGMHEGAFSIGPFPTTDAPAAVPSSNRGPVGAGKTGSGPTTSTGAGLQAEKGAGLGNGAGSNPPGPPSNVPDNPDASPAGNPALSIAGPAGGTGIAAGTLPPLKPEDLVYEVKPDTPKVHAPTMVVSTSGYGGGGLRVYGVLHGEKVYTVYFSMPRQAWVLEYCARQDAPKTDTVARVVQITIQPPLVPPSAIDEYDYHRPNDPATANSLVILHGLIHVDGTVSDLTVVQGVDPTTDAAARAAFSRWKFKPAERSGAPVELEILVGIP